jgi:hypothetical protein
MLGYAFPVDSSLTVIRLIDSGLFDEARDLALIVSRAGGVLPFSHAVWYGPPVRPPGSRS